MDKFEDGLGSEMTRRKSPRWAWWLYLVVGCFIVGLLIWMFIALSDHNEKMQEQEQSIYQTETPDSVAPALPPSQL